MLSEFELGELYRACMINVSYLFAYEYGESPDQIRDEGRWNAWFSGVQENYGYTLNRVMDALVGPHEATTRLTEEVYRDDFMEAVRLTVGSMCRSPFESLMHQVGWGARDFGRSVRFLDVVVAEWMPVACGLGTPDTAQESDYMWTDWGLDTRSYLE